MEFEGLFNNSLLFIGVAVFTVIVGAVFIWYCLLYNAKERGAPPAKEGWLPWLGVAIQFGKAPLDYIEESHIQLGDVFTLYVVGKRMTFLFDYKDSHTYFKSPAVSFQQAVIDYTTASASIDPKSFCQYHTTIHDIFKGQLTSHHIDPLCQALSVAFHDQISSRVKDGEIELMQLVRNTMFTPVVKQLFGDENLQLSENEMDEMMNKFVKYDADFEYAQLPDVFNKEWVNVKKWLLKLLQGVASKLLSADPPKHVIGHVLKAVDPPNAAGYALMTLWASQANAIPISFWTIAFILSTPSVLKTVQEELKEWSFTNTDGTFVNITESHLKTAPPTIKRAIVEAIRLRSPGIITRKLTKPLQVKGYTIPKGHYLMLSPYHCHRNPTYFSDPSTFNPDRWLDCDLDKNQFIPGFIAFGGGRYQCPGRWFALMELHLYISMMLKMIDITLIDKVPEPSTLHLTGSQQPQESCHVKIKLKY